MSRIEAMNAVNEKRMIRTWSRTLHGLPGDGRAHDRGPRRAQARAGVRQRADGRAQARRVRADPDVPRPRGRQADPGEEALVAATRHRKQVVARRGEVRPPLGPQGAGRARPHPRPQRARGADDPRLHAARGRARHREGAALGGRERRGEPRPRRRRARRRGGLRRRGPDAEALARPRPRPRQPDPQAHVPHHARSSARPEGRERRASGGRARAPTAGAALPESRSRNQGAVRRAKKKEAVA